MTQSMIMQHYGIAWFARVPCLGRCTCCDIQNGRDGHGVFRGYNGGQGLSVYICSTCRADGHTKCEIRKLTQDAREKLARWLFLDAHRDDMFAQSHWDFGGDQHVNKTPWRQKADDALGIICER